MPGDWVRLWDAATGKEKRAFLTGHNYFSGLAFAPDGRLIATSGHDGAVRLWEVSSGQLRRKYEGHRGGVNGVDFAPDGQRLVSAGQDGTALVWRVFDPPAGRADLAATWADLARDGESAHRAVAALVAAKEADGFLAARLKPAAAPPEAQMKRWLADLGSPQFATREAAEKGLARAGELAEPALRRELAAATNPEVRRRLTALLENVARVETRPEQMRELRAVEVLERRGTPDAERLLAELAKGAPDVRLTQEAKAALERAK